MCILPSSLTLPLLLFCAALPGQDAPEEATGLAELEKQQLEAAVRHDHEALTRVLQRLGKWTEQHPEQTEAHLAIARAGWQLSFELSGFPRIEPETQRRLQQAVDHLRRAIRLAPSRVEAHALLALCRLFQSQLEPSDASERSAQSRQALDRAIELDPKSPHVLIATAIRESAGRRPNLEDAERFERAVERFAEVRGRQPADWWELATLGWTIRTHLLTIPPSYDRAAELIDRALELREDYRLVKEVLRPLVAQHTLIPIDATQGLTWRALAEDPSGDDKGGVDGVRLAVAEPADGEHVWFRFELQGDVPEDAFGVNLVLDTDRDEETGSRWWGTSGISFDRLVTVWVARDDAGFYRGIVGVGSADSATAGDPTDRLRGGIGFALGERAILIRVPRGALDDDGRLRVLGAVGTNMGWSDDLPDRAPVELELAQENHRR